MNIVLPIGIMNVLWEDLLKSAELDKDIQAAIKDLNDLFPE
jgi:hypothetical protein